MCVISLVFHNIALGKSSKKKTEKSDIAQKGRVGWNQKTYFQKERISDMIIGQGWKIH